MPLEPFGRVPYLTPLEDKFAASLSFRGFAVSKSHPLAHTHQTLVILHH
jgi:hypothetical protein